MNTEDARTLRHWLSTPQRILLIPHKNPDGDAMGACLGLQQFLLGFQDDVVVACPNEFPAFLKWMPGNDDVIARFDAMGAEARAMSRDDFNTYLASNYEKWSKVIEEANIKQ